MVLQYYDFGSASQHVQLKNDITSITTLYNILDVYDMGEYWIMQSNVIQYVLYYDSKNSNEIAAESGVHAERIAQPSYGYHSFLL